MDGMEIAAIAAWAGVIVNGVIAGWRLETKFNCHTSSTNISEQYSRLSRGILSGREAPKA